MYLTAASAAWRYSGKVTGPVSSLIRPTVIGAPDACFGVPSGSAAAAVVVEEDVPVDFEVELDDLSLLLPQPAATTATSRATTMTSGRRSDFMSLPFLSCGDDVAEVTGLDEVWPLAQLPRRPFQDQLSVAEDVCPVSQLQGFCHVLLYEQHACPEVSGNPAQDRQEPLHDHRGQTEAHLVDEQQPGLSNQCASDREHLLLASGENARLAVEALLELGEERQQLLLLERIALLLRKLEVIAHRHPEEQGAALRDQREAVAREPVRGHRSDVFTREEDGAAEGRDQPGDRRHRRGLACPVRAEQCDNFAGIDTDVQIAHHGRAQIPGVERLDLKKRHAGPPRCPGRRR